MVAAAAVILQEDDNPILELMHHLSPHNYGWAPNWGPFTISNAVFNIWLAAALVMIVFWVAVSKPKLVPKGMQNLIEVATDFVKDNMVYTVMNVKDGRAWFPFIGTVFFFILFMNLVGLIPYIGFTPTSNVFVTAALALPIYLMAVTIGMVKHGPLKFWIKTLVPGDVPKALLPLMIPIEIVSQLARPFSLAVRLFANMFADHLLLLIFVGFMFLASGIVLGILFPFLMLAEIVFTAFGMFVAFIQAVIFAFLTTIYINDALHPGH